MQRTTEQAERMARYLLGDLPENEAIVVEQEYFADTEKFEAIWSAENELVDRYVRDRLTRGERELFERNYLQSPKHRDRVAVARRLLEAADHRNEENSPASQVFGSAPFKWGAKFEILNWSKLLRFGLPAMAMLLLVGVLALLVLERSRLTTELERTKAQLSDQQRRAQEISDQLAIERAQNGAMKSEIDRMRDTLAQQPAPLLGGAAKPSIFSFFLSPLGTIRSEGASQQQLTIPRGTDQIRLQMKVGTENARTYRAVIRTVEGAQIWTQRSITPRSGAVSVNAPADKFPLGDYILTLSATTATGETQEVNRYFFRVIRK
jgi:hypothetical protein